jgi:hypothetical protein
MMPPPKSPDKLAAAPVNAEVDRTDESEDSSLTTKKFRLRKSLKCEMQDYAETHYQGNASQFLRAAIRDHVRTLEDENEYVIRKLQAKLEDVEEQLTELTETVSKTEASQPLPPQQQMKNQSGQQPLTETQSPESSEHSGLQTETYRCIATADSSQLTLGELLEQTDSDLSGLSKAIEQLTDRGRLTSVPGTEHPTYEINSPTENND